MLKGGTESSSRVCLSLSPPSHPTNSNARTEINSTCLSAEFSYLCPELTLAPPRCLSLLSLNFVTSSNFPNLLLSLITATSLIQLVKYRMARVKSKPKHKDQQQTGGKRPRATGGKKIPGKFNSPFPFFLVRYQIEQRLALDRTSSRRGGAKC